MEVWVGGRVILSGAGYPEKLVHDGLGGLCDSRFLWWYDACTCIIMFVSLGVTVGSPTLICAAT